MNTNRLKSTFCIFFFSLIVSYGFAILSVPAYAQASAEDQPNSWRYKSGQVVNDSDEELLGQGILQGGLQNTLKGTASLQSNVYARGIDVSEWQGDINWDAVKNSGQVDFAIIRCGFGGTSNRADYKWERNVSECERLGIPYGVYIYSYATSWGDLNSEVEHVKQLIGGHSPVYPVFIDMEDNSTIGCGRDTLTAFARSFCQQIQDAGFVSGVYSSTNWFNNVLYGSQLDNYVKWVAQWNWQCTYGGKYQMWQYSSDGSVPGISGRVDMNYLVEEIAVNENRFKGVYDYDFYLENNSDVARAYGGNRYKTLCHFIIYGMNEGRRASVIFDKDYYKSSYEDLIKAYGSDNRSYYTHFLEWGMDEGRNGSSMFEFSTYKQNYSDLRTAYGSDNKKYYEHFQDWGMSEGRKATSTFDLGSYYNRYQDLRKFYRADLKRYYSHYVIYGIGEKRNPLNCATLQNPVTTLSGTNWSLVYDGNYYVNKYSDLKKAYTLRCNYNTLIDDTALLEHFFNWGMSEGRQAKSTFLVEAYYNRYYDLRVAYRSDLKAYYKHYIDWGKREGRETLNCATLQNPVSWTGGMNYSLVYDGNYYVNKYADLKKAYSLKDHPDLIDDVALIEHFASWGMDEHRQAKNTFDVMSYYNEYSDLRAAFGKNWKSYYLHYIQCGYKEGRNTTGCNTLKG